MSEILASTTAAATSSEFAITGPVSIQITGLAGTEFCVLEYQYNSAGAWFQVTSVGKEGRLQASEMPKLLVGPGNYRIQKFATANAVAIAYEG